MPKDYLRTVAAAYGANDSRMGEIAQKALQEIDQTVEDLQSQASMIRKLLGRATKALPKPVTTVKVISTPFPEEVGAKLTDSLKDQIREYAINEFRLTNRWLTAQELVERMRSSGTNFGVSQPVPSVGTVLAAARKQYEASDQNPPGSTPSFSAQTKPKTYADGLLAILAERPMTVFTLRDLTTGLQERGWMPSNGNSPNAVEIVRGAMKQLASRDNHVRRVSDQPVTYTYTVEDRG